MYPIQILILCGAVYFTYTEKSKQNQKILLFVTGLLFIHFVTQVEGIEGEGNEEKKDFFSEEVCRGGAVVMVIISFVIGVVMFWLGVWKGKKQAGTGGDGPTMELRSGRLEAEG